MRLNRAVKIVTEANAATERSRGNPIRMNGLDEARLVIARRIDKSEDEQEIGKLRSLLSPGLPK